MEDFVGKKIDSGYVIYDPKRDCYYTANAGLFKTRQNPQKKVDQYAYYKNCKVVKVNLVIAEETDD